MPILKHRNNTGYVKIPNILAQSSNISYEAIGVLVNLLSRPEDWVVKKTSLLNEHCGQVMLNRIFKELQDHGYLIIRDIRENGQIRDREWIVSDEPMPSIENDTKTLGNLNDGKPQIEETSPWGNQQLQIKNNTNKENTKKENPLCGNPHREIIFNNFEITEPEFTEQSYSSNRFPYELYKNVRNVQFSKEICNNSELVLQVLSKIVLKHFNWVTGSRFRPTNTNVLLIKKCLSTGSTIGDCFAINLSKFREWKDDKVMSKYVRIKTLYSLSNFEQYLGEIKTRDYRNELQEK